MLVYIHSQQRDWEMWELLLGANWQGIIQENYNDMRNRHLSELMCEVSFPLFASHLTPVSVNGNHHWL